jgi:hypothetical protein
MFLKVYLQTKTVGEIKIDDKITLKEADLSNDMNSFFENRREILVNIPGRIDFCCIGNSPSGTFLYAFVCWLFLFKKLISKWLFYNN